jgi:DNA (cytosine-5)-methyltransferase 1
MQHFCKKNVKKLQKRFLPYICGMEKLRHGSLFSGIGGFDLAAEWMGWENVFHCEWNEFGQRVLKHYWPNAESFSDITKTDFTKYYGTVDIITGGFPCQPYSSAGKRRGKEDERHLWPEMLRAIREVSPRFVVGENVRGLTNWNGGLVFDEVCAELESLGYQVAPVIIPACGVGAPHRRERIWFVAYASKPRYENRSQHSRYTKENDKGIIGFAEARITTDAQSERGWKQQEENRTGENRLLINYDEIGNASNATSSGRGQDNRLRKSGLNNKTSKRNNWNNFPTQSPICGGNDGLSSELDGITFSKWRNESIKAYGNAIVPQVAFEIFKALEKSLYL